MVLDRTPRFADIWEGDLCRELLFLSTVDKEVLSSGQNKLGGDSLQKKCAVHGLQKCQGLEVDTLKPTICSDSVRKMPEEQKELSLDRDKDASAQSRQDIKQKPAEKKGSKTKVNVRHSTVRVWDTQSMEELQDKEDAETNRKAHETLDSFIRQTIRCEPYMNFTSRTVDKSLHRLRHDVFENHGSGKFAKNFKFDSGSDTRDFGIQENHGIGSRTSEMDGVLDTSSGSIKSTAGLGHGSQHSMKLTAGVSFAHAAPKGTDTQGWLSPSKVTLIKCEKCAREFCASLNYRRHVRVHRRSLNPEKDDLSKERPKVAAFWDKLTPEEASTIVQFENMEIEDLSGHSALNALIGFIQQPGLPSVSQSILKAGAVILDIVQNKGSVFPLPSERLLNILDDASEKTFLCGGTSLAVQRFVFNGDAAKVGLEEKNVVATMGFHLELNLVKAWMADKEAEALRCQQALFKEEEAAQQKRAKVLEKKRMKKIRQKERKGSVSQLILLETENESLFEEGTMQGNGEDDDSPTATGSSAFSLASAQDLAQPDAVELDILEDVLMLEPRDEHLLSGESSVQNHVVEEAHSFRPDHEYVYHGRDKTKLVSTQDSNEGLDRKEYPLLKKLVFGDKGLSSPPTQSCETTVDSVIELRSNKPAAQSRSGKTVTVDVNPNLYFGRIEQERIGLDSKRQDSDRKSQVGRDKPRNEYLQSMQKLGKDSQGSDGRHGEGVSHASFKPARKFNAHFLKGDNGTSDLHNISKAHVYRNKLSGFNRTISTAGNGQVVWTRKFPQPPRLEVVKIVQEERQENTNTSKTGFTDGWEMNEVLPEVAAITATDLREHDSEVKLGPVEKEDSAVLPSGGNRCAGVDKEILKIEEGLSCALLVGSLHVPLGKFATENLLHNLPGSNIQHAFQLDHVEVAQVNWAENSSESSDSFSTSQEVLKSKCLGLHVGSVGSDIPDTCRTVLSVPNSEPNTSEGAMSKLHTSISSRNRGEGCCGNIATPLVQEKLMAKQRNWQTSAGPVVPSKVWRPVGTSGECHDSSALGLHAAWLIDSRPFLGIVNEKEKNSREVGSGSLPGLFLKDERYSDNDHLDDLANDSYVPSPSSAPSSTRSPACNSFSNGQADYLNQEISDNRAESTVLASGLCSLSVLMEFAGAFFGERWRAALAHASVDEILALAIEDGTAEGVSNESEGGNFLEMVLVQLSNQTPGHFLSAKSLVSSSSDTTQALGEGTEGQEILSSMDTDIDQTVVVDSRSLSSTDEHGFDGVGAQEDEIVLTVSLEHDTRMREASTSPVQSEQFMSGSGTTNTSFVISSTEVDVMLDDKSAASCEVGTAVLSHARCDYKHDKWYRCPRDRFLEQRYIPRRVPSEKNC